MNSFDSASNLHRITENIDVIFNRVLTSLRKITRLVAPDNLDNIQKLKWYLTIHIPPLTPKSLYDDIDILYDNFQMRIPKKFEHNRLGTVLNVWQGDITELEVDAIVNAGNVQGLGCFRPEHKCIDNIIHAAAGPRLRLEEYIKLKDSQIPVGGVNITSGYHLYAKYVITTVGPVYSEHTNEKSSNLLSTAYQNCLKIADKHKIKSLAFSSISTGLFGFPKPQACEIAYRTVKQWVRANPNTSIKLIIFNTFDKENTDYYRHIVMDEKLHNYTL